MAKLASRKVFNLVGSAAAPVTLDTSYGDTEAGVVNIEYGEYIKLYVFYTMGSAETSNSIQIKVQESPDTLAIDSTLWGQTQTEVISTGTRTLSDGEFTKDATTAAGTYMMIPLPLPEVVGAKTIKVSLKETGVASNAGSAYVRVAVLGN